MGLLLGAAVAGDGLTKAMLAWARLTGLLADNATHAVLAGLCWWVVVAANGGGPEELEEGDRRSQYPKPAAAAAATASSSSSSSSSSSITKARRRETLAATLAGSLLDLDHFIAARSLTRLEPALQLARRPPGHCLAAVLLGGLLVYAGLRAARAGACCCLAACSPRHRHHQRRPQPGPNGNGGSTKACVPPAGAPLRWTALLLTAALSHQLRDGVRRGLWLVCKSGEGGINSGYSTPPIPYLLYLVCLALLPLAVRRLLRACGARHVSGGPEAGATAAGAYRRVRDDWEAEWGDGESEDEEWAGEEEGVEMQVVIV